MKKPKPTLLELIAEHVKQKDLGKEHYAKADDLLDVIVRQMKRVKVLDLGDGTQAELVNNFDGKNVAWKAAGVRRFDIKISRRKEASLPEKKEDAA